MSKETAHIYQDESGSLADPAGTVVIIALVAVLDPWSLRFITKKVYKNFLAKKGKKYKNRGRKEPKRFFYPHPEKSGGMTLSKQGRMHPWAYLAAILKLE